MTAEIFLLVVCSLALKYTLELAGSTRPVRRMAAAQLQRLASAVDTPWLYVAGGLLLALIGWVSDRPRAGWVLAAGLAISQAGVFAAGARYGRRQRTARGPRSAPAVTHSRGSRAMVHAGHAAS